mmetsp:Transcript_11004/g.40977  ORF Transcript_11004/g.40977 Transcript_11004/m.40977 type:complete len:140 (-) Transcript_11004:500-919(-)
MLSHTFPTNCASNCPHSSRSKLVHIFFISAVVLIFMVLCSGLTEATIDVYVSSVTGNDTLPSASYNFGTDSGYPAKTLQRVLGRWKNETHVTIHVAAGTYKLNQLSFTKEEDFELKWTSPVPTLFGTYPGPDEPYEEDV